MYLLIDIGNENVKWCCGTQRGVFPSLRSAFAGHLQQHFGELESVSGIVFVNVAARKLVGELQQFAARQWQIPITQVTSTAAQCGIRNSYRNIEELGADRWVALVGARSIHPGGSIIIDCGTAITVDALSSDGEFIGGSILPGFKLAQASLWRRTSGIAEFHTLVPKLPSRSTIEAVSSGVVFSIAGGVDRLVSKYCNLLGGSPNLLLTGGSAALLEQHSTYSFETIPDLTLTGLDVISKSLNQTTPTTHKRRTDETN